MRVCGYAGMWGFVGVIRLRTGLLRRNGEVGPRRLCRAAVAEEVSGVALVAVVLTRGS